MMKPTTLATLKTLLRNSRSGSTGSRGPALDEDERDEQHDAEHREPDDLRRAPTGRSLPPRLVNRTIAESPPARSAIPA